MLKNFLVINFLVIIFMVTLLFCPFIQADENNQTEVSCFCYRNKKYDNIIRDCKEIQAPNDAFPTIRCYDSIKEEYITFTPPDEDWERIEGADCQKTKKRSKENTVPKGSND